MLFSSSLTALLSQAAIVAAAAAAVVVLPPSARPDSKDYVEIDQSAERVDFTLGVMSRCPDATYTERYLDDIISRINDKINLKFSYIGQRDKEEEKYGVTCKHGSQECDGNVHQLCVQDLLLSSADSEQAQSQAQHKLWDFIDCENYQGLGSIGKEAVAKQCLRTIRGPAWEDEDGVRDCIEGPLGRKLLRKSVKASANAGIEKSATIQLEGKTICVRDGGQWKDCPGGHGKADFVRQVDEAWRAKNNLAPVSYDDEADWMSE